MIRWFIAAALLLGVGASGVVQARQARHADVDAQACLVEVLDSEMLPVGPMFYHTVQATLRITPPGSPPVVRTIEKVIPWQAPPPRQGQVMRMNCDQAALGSQLFAW